jgi:hypothetical protein
MGPAPAEDFMIILDIHNLCKEVMTIFFVLE